jgi:cephalosporin hydroxylase
MNIRYERDGVETSVDLYSREGLEAVSDLWVRSYAHHKLTHEITWLGAPVIQLPLDMIMMQELIWKVRPDAIVECGLAHGGSAIFYASVQELIGHGFVVGVDVEIRRYNRVMIENHPLSHRIRMVEGSSIEPATVHSVKEKLASADRVLVVLDSNHSTEHVLAELRIYKDLVTPRSYMVAMDGAQAFLWDSPSGKPEWKQENPLRAIEMFLEENKEFEVDDHYTRLVGTANPKGFLRKK